MAPITFGVLTVSDSCYAGANEDTSGPKLQEAIKKAFPNALISFKTIIPDDQSVIEKTLIDWTKEKCNVILTTGGTGFSERDVTPEATRRVIDKDATGLATCMLLKSLEVTPMAMLSRAAAGIRDKTIIINLPGSSKAAIECFSFVKDVLPHAVDLLDNNSVNVVKVHKEVQNILASKVRIKCAALRDRTSPYPMLSIEEALNLILNEVHTKFSTSDLELIDINDSLNRVLGEDIYSNDPLPPFPASIKDGYAVIAEDGCGIRIVRNAIAAGDTPYNVRLQKGEIIRINTGAPVPLGADAVVQVEDTELVESSPEGDIEISVKINVAPTPGQDIRTIGSDIPANSKVLDKNNVITPGHIGILATVGSTKINVYKRFTIGLVSTGNELQNPHECLKPGHIRDSNKLTLLHLLKQFHYFADDCGIARDDPNDLKAVLTKAMLHHDVVITTGGVSMGEFDVVKQVLQTDFNAKIHFGRVNMKPGKPTTFASCTFNGTPKLIFALPGNPVSATVTTILFVLPALRAKESNPDHISQLKVQLNDDINLDPRPEYMRAQVIEAEGKFIAKVTGNQISSRLNSFVGAQALLILPGKTPHCSVLKKGTQVNALRI